ncbi:hypothetical protein [Arenimonas sp.]|uniref:hypothetical protein n=1 Tax=Arenimonas sp. TaxID=1872635 RepID=UPI0039E60B00
MNPRLALASLILAAVAAPAMAGYEFLQEVSVTPTSAQGSVSGARRAADAVQYIYCTSSAVLSGAVSGTCNARDKFGNTRSCSTTVPAMIDAIQSIDDSSFVLFQVNGSGQCSSISVYRGSPYMDP